METGNVEKFWEAIRGMTYKELREVSNYIASSFEDRGVEFTDAEFAEALSDYAEAWAED